MSKKHRHGSPEDTPEVAPGALGRVVSNATPFQFEAGDIVDHQRYGYRGVVFGRDPVCQANEGWYMNNQTQPNRQQPWYHVMVDGAEHTTYVAESNLRLSDNPRPVRHPMIKKIFATHLEGRYWLEPLN